MTRIDSFLELVVQQGGSDLHLVSGQAPRIRLHGDLQCIRFRELSTEDMVRLLAEIMTEAEKETLKTRRSADFAYDVEGLGRFRVNVQHQMTGLAAVFRVLPPTIRTPAELGLPDVIARIVAEPNGLILVTGPSGSGKSTTLAAIIDQINGTRRGHIITLEDPIEFVHGFKKSVVTQRQIGLHAVSFAEALRNALRKDPDVVMVGEMRDLETVSLALTAAETGVQVLASLHTLGAVRTVDRIVNVFSPARRDQIRVMLGESLKLVISQQLVQTADGEGRRAVFEILVNTSGAAAMIRSGKGHNLSNVIQAGAHAGMQSLDAQLEILVRQGVISGEEAHLRSIDKVRFDRFLPRFEAA
jgi:twitching motility protein PilT